MPQPIIDLTAIDLNQVLHGSEEIEAVNPHRPPMRMLDGIIHVKNAPNAAEAVAFKDIGHDEFWTAGHIPGRPLFPGVLMIEAAAQLASYVTVKFRSTNGKFLGFIGADDFKFRGQVVPGDRLIVLAKEVEFRPGRRFVSLSQGLVNGAVVFEGKITGMPI